MANTDRPVISPLSNPTTYAEALPDDIYRWTEGKALIATGSPFPPINDMRIGQCNNVFIFPGLGLGILASGTREVLPSFFTAAARTVADMVSSEDQAKGILTPPVSDLQKVCKQVAIEVGKTAIMDGVSGLCVYSKFQHDNDPNRLATIIEKMQWQPYYLPLVAQ